MSSWADRLGRLRPRDDRRRRRHEPHRVRVHRRARRRRRRLDALGLARRPRHRDPRGRRAPCTASRPSARAPRAARPRSWSREITQTLRALFGLGIPVVVYNAPYDLSLLDRECRRHGLDAARRPDARHRSARDRQGRRPVPQGQAHARGDRRALRGHARRRARRRRGCDRRRSGRAGAARAPTPTSSTSRSPTCTAGRRSGTPSRPRASRSTSAAAKGDDELHRIDRRGR